ncbi:MAG: hypothetical protein ABSH19_04370 [Opitutales bacterium]|jgi:hypothetical protein
MHFRTLISFLLLALLGYTGYGYAVSHFNRPSLCYQNFAAALVRDDPDRARIFAWDGGALAAFNFSSQRTRDLQSGQIKLEYYVINSFYYSEDGNTATIDAVHTVRIDPPGTSSVFGSVAVSFPERVQLEQRDGLWRVKRFDDYYTMNALKQQTQ